MSVKEWLQNNKVKLIVGSIVTLACLILLFVFVGGLLTGHPNNNNPRLYGTRKVRIESNLRNPTDTWSNENLNVVRNSLQEASRLGPTFQLVTEGEADVTIYKAEYPNCDRNNMDPAGEFILNTRQIHIDPRCTHSNNELQSAVVHELGHFVGMGHICVSAGMNRNDCSSVGRGYAVMNPGLVVETDQGRQGPQTTSAYTPDTSTWQVTDLDVKEFLRAWNSRRTSR